MSIRPAWLWWKRRQKTMKNIRVLGNTVRALDFLSVLADWDLGLFSLLWALWAPGALSGSSVTGNLNVLIIDWDRLILRTLFSLFASNWRSVETSWAPGAPWGAMTTASADSRQALVLCERRLIVENRYVLLPNISSHSDNSRAWPSGWHKLCNAN